jgi:hypothetical protein
MAEKKRKKIFEENLEVFAEPNIKTLRESEEGISKPPAPKKKARRVSQSSNELETLIKNLQALGFKITPPTTQQDQERQEASLEMLGFADTQPKKALKEEQGDAFVTFTLGARHTISNHVFGPGEVTLPREEAALIQTLVKQDQLCRLAHMDTAQYNPISRSFLIKPGNGLDQHHKYRKIEVSAAQLQSATDNDQDFSQISVTAGAFDVAGYNPQFNQERLEF